MRCRTRRWEHGAERDGGTGSGWADQTRAIARTGLHYATSEYDRERYVRLEEVAADMLESVSGLGRAEVVSRWAAETGYVTPKVGLGAAVMTKKARYS